MLKGRSRIAGLAALAGATAIGVSALTATAAVAATPTMHGTYSTPATTGTISYTPLRAIRYGSEGTFVVNGTRRPGSMYAATGGGTGLVWYYGTSGLMAGNALVTRQPDGTYSGQVWFFDRAGATTDAGTITATFP